MIRSAFPAISTRQSFRDVIELFSTVDGTPFDTTGAKVQVSIGGVWPEAYGWGWGASYGGVDYYDNPFFSQTPLLTLSTEDGSIPTAFESAGKYPFVFTPAQMATLCPGQYVVGANISRDGYAAQLVLGTLPIVDGVVPQ